MADGTLRAERRPWWIVAALLALMTSTASSAQDARVAAAKAKGTVNVYSALASEELRRDLSEGFRRATGVQTSVYYAGTAQLFSRIATEAKTGAATADVVVFSDVDIAQEIANTNAFRSYKPAELPANSVAVQHHAQGFWATFASFGATLEYNTRMVSAKDAPQSWTELAEPKWKSKVAIADPARSNLGFLMLKIMVKEHGWPWIEKLLRNDPLVFTLAPQIDQSIAAGERLVGTSTTFYASEFLKMKAPIAADPEPLFLLSFNAGILAKSNNPVGGELFVDYLLGEEASKLLVKYGYFATRTGAPGPEGFPSVDKLKVRVTTIPSDMTRQEYLDRYSAIAQSVKK